MGCSVPAASVRIRCFLSWLAAWGLVCVLLFLHRLSVLMGWLSVLECAFRGFLPLFALLHLFTLFRLFVTFRKTRKRKELVLHQIFRSPDREQAFMSAQQLAPRMSVVHRMQLSSYWHAGLCASLRPQDWGNSMQCRLPSLKQMFRGCSRTVKFHPRHCPKQNTCLIHDGSCVMGTCRTSIVC